jgi:hypothetical protein
VLTEGNRTRLVFEELDIKTGRPLEYLVPHEMQGHIERYLAVERVELLNGATQDWFWVNRHGQRLGQRGLACSFRSRTGKEFPHAFGTHRFRHALGTTAPMADPGNPGVAAAILGISGAVHEAHYIRAGQTEAATLFADAIRPIRAKTESLARRGFRSAADRRGETEKEDE